MNIGIIGVGYVGLVSGACFSDFGHNVFCTDSNSAKLEKLRNGQIPIFEPGLDALVEKNTTAERLFFIQDLDPILKKLDVIFIAVGTPTNQKDGSADLSNLLKVCDDINHKLDNAQIVVLKSTVPIGTNGKIASLIKSIDGNSVEIVSNPEFLREGSAIEDFMRPDRVIIGLRSKKAVKVMAEVYKPLYLRDFAIMYSDPESAETIKYASNAFLATKISFINEIAELCENTGADVKEVSKGMGLDGRIGSKFLHAGPGFGGSCFPKDTLALAKIGRNNNSPQSIVETVIDVNQRVKERMVKKILKIFNGNIGSKTITILGVTFKPNTDDIRESSSLSIIKSLLDGNAKVRVVDPKATRKQNNLLNLVDWYEDAYTACKSSDLVVILTEWNEFRALNLREIASNMKFPRLADFRNIYDRETAKTSGFKEYVSVGRR